MMGKKKTGWGLFEKEKEKEKSPFSPEANLKILLKIPRTVVRGWEVEVEGGIGT